MNIIYYYIIPRPCVSSSFEGFIQGHTSCLPSYEETRIWKVCTVEVCMCACVCVCTVGVCVYGIVIYALYTVELFNDL